MNASHLSTNYTDSSHLTIPKSDIQAILSLPSLYEINHEGAPPRGGNTCVVGVKHKCFSPTTPCWGRGKNALNPLLRSPSHEVRLKQNQIITPPSYYVAMPVNIGKCPIYYSSLDLCCTA